MRHEQEKTGELETSVRDALESLVTARPFVPFEIGIGNQRIAITDPTKVTFGTYGIRIRSGKEKTVVCFQEIEHWEYLSAVG